MRNKISIAFAAVAGVCFVGWLIRNYYIKTRGERP